MKMCVSCGRVDATGITYCETPVGRTSRDDQWLRHCGDPTVGVAYHGQVVSARGFM